MRCGSAAPGTEEGAQTPEQQTATPDKGATSQGSAVTHLRCGGYSAIGLL